MPPEIDGLNYASRVKVPVLMMNGRHDAIFPYETSQQPLLRLLATPPDQKRHLVFPGALLVRLDQRVDQEGLDWLDTVVWSAGSIDRSTASSGRDGRISRARREMRGERFVSAFDDEEAIELTQVQ